MPDKEGAQFRVMGQTCFFCLSKPLENLLETVHRVNHGAPQQGPGRVGSPPQSEQSSSSSSWFSSNLRDATPSCPTTYGSFLVQKHINRHWSFSRLSTPKELKTRGWRELEKGRCCTQACFWRFSQADCGHKKLVYGGGDRLLPLQPVATSGRPTLFFIHDPMRSGRSPLTRRRDIPGPCGPKNAGFLGEKTLTGTRGNFQSVRKLFKSCCGIKTVFNILKLCHWSGRGWGGMEIVCGKSRNLPTQLGLEKRFVR